MWDMIARGVYTCNRCGNSVNRERNETELDTCITCVKKGLVEANTMEKVTMILPSVSELAKNYSNERKRWVEAGKPVRTEERILEIYDSHCEPCDFRKKNRCGFCGCFVKREGTIFNKIAWGTTKCAFKYHPFWKEETDPNNLRNATQEEIDAFNEEQEELDKGKVDEELTKEMVTEDTTPQEAVEIIKQQVADNPPKKKGCGCGG